MGENRLSINRLSIKCKGTRGKTPFEHKRCAELYWLCAGRSSIDLDEPHFEALVHHEVKSEELEALVGQVLGADGRLDACQTAPVRPDGDIVSNHTAVCQTPRQRKPSMQFIGKVYRNLLLWKWKINARKSAPCRGVFTAAHKYVITINKLEYYMCTSITAV